MVGCATNSRMMAPDSDRANEVVASSAENAFVELFQDAIGFAGLQWLQGQVRFQDLDGRGRMIDFALESPMDRYAFEVDGEYHHRPDSPGVDPTKFGDDLFRQNSLVQQGWWVYRWTDTQIAGERDRVVEQLRLFLERELAAGTFGKLPYLPMQEGGEFALYEHQAEALAALARFRAEGKTIALLTHATGTGKTHVAISDAKRVGGRVLYLAHTRQLPKQTSVQFRQKWPGVTAVVYKGAEHDEAKLAGVVLSTLQAMDRNLSRFDPAEFAYVIVDEAHHAAADTFARVVEYFRPKFLLGLSATPERGDGRSLLAIFQETAHRLSLEEAVERGILVPIRCFRVETNIDLGQVRYNGVDYRLKDLEQAVRLPGRDRLIVETYLRHVAGRRAVCFCVNVDHAERVAEEFRSQGVAAASVSGRMAGAAREGVLAGYETGEIAVLCACDMLNEGWDSPRTEVLMMARPTLSKVLYVQQLGRGTRCAEGKECLFVFDFVDRTNRMAQGLSVHRVFGKAQYRAGALVAAPVEMLGAEEAMYEGGVVPPLVLGVNVYETGLQPIDIFRWQDEAAGMVTAAEMARELRLDDDTIRQRVRRGEMVADLRVPMGEREHLFFAPERVAEYREQFGIAALSGENIRELFFDYLERGEMSSSYKPVLLLGMLRCADGSGRVKVVELLAYFRGFYLERAAAGLVVEKGRVKMARVGEMSDLEIERTMLEMPFERFEKQGFLARMRDLAMVRFDSVLWRRLTAADKARALRIAAGQLAEYYGNGAEIPA